MFPTTSPAFDLALALTRRDLHFPNARERCVAGLYIPFNERTDGASVLNRDEGPRPAKT